MKTSAIFAAAAVLAFSALVSAQVPTVSLISPALGDTGTSITITGTNFSAAPLSNLVRFGPVRARVLSASSTQLTVSVPPGAGFAHPEVEVAGLTASARQMFLPIFSGHHLLVTGTFAPKVDVLARDPYNLALCDLDGDGRPDVLVSNQFDTTISIYRNISTPDTLAASSLDAPVKLTTGLKPIGIACGDLDGDGKPDIALVDYDQSAVSVIRNTTSAPGVFSFEPQLLLPTDPGAAPFNVVIRDLNGDGLPDLIVANDVGGTVAVYENQSVPGNLSFRSRVEFATNADPFVAVGDIDGDGRPDLVAANWGNSTVSVLRNLVTVPGSHIDTTSFAPKVDAACGSNPYSAALADLDGDGLLDIMTADESDGTVSVFRNTSTSGSISLAPRLVLAAGGGTRFVAPADLDGDGKPDLATANRWGNSVSLFRNQSTAGTLSFSPQSVLTAGVRPRFILANDLDLDSRPDLVVANEGTPLSPGNTISLFRNVLGDGFTIQASATGGGTITPSGNVFVLGGDAVRFTFSPQAGHHFLGLTVDGAPVDSASGYTFSNVSANHTIAATFALDTFQIVASKTGPGTVSPLGTIAAVYGSTQAFFFTPDTGYRVKDVVVDNQSVGRPSSYTFSNVSASHTLSVTFTLDTLVIAATSAGNGVLSPQGSVKVPYGSSQGFSMTPGTGSHIASVLVDSVGIGAPSGYTFTDVRQNHTLFVQFVPDSFALSLSAGPHGSLSPSGTLQMPYDTTVTVTVLPDTGYHIDSVFVDNVFQGALASYQFQNIHTGHTLRAVFGINHYQISASAGSHGTITPSGVIDLVFGASQVFVMHPDAGYHVDSLMVDGARVASDTSYTFTPVRANHVITATFAIDTLTVTSVAGPNGTVTPLGSILAVYGTSLHFSFQAAVGHHIDSVIVDGTLAGRDTGYTFAGITQSHLLRVAFAIDTFHIQASAAEGGTLNLPGSTPVVYGGGLVYYFTPDPGHYVDSLVIDGSYMGHPSSYAFTNVTSDHTLFVHFDHRASSDITCYTTRGWNLVSLPVVVPAPYKDAIFSGTSSHAFAFGSTGYIMQDTLGFGKGYWLKFSQPETTQISGLGYPGDSIAVTTGWNLIGTEELAMPVSGMVTSPPGISQGIYFGYEGRYSPVTDLVPGKGYWVKMFSPGYLYLRPDAAGVPAKAVSAAPPALHQLTIRDALGRAQTLYFGGGERGALDLRAYELPPPPPAGGFDVRFTSGNGLVACGAKEKPVILPISIQGEYPVTVSWQMSASTAKQNAQMLVDGKRKFLRGASGSFRLSDPAGEVSLRLSGADEVPQSYVLRQNYPNPFNPSTVVTFGIPAAADVALRVYDVLGREVATLVNEKKEAGTYEVEWTAANCPSGIYFYRITAGAYSSTRKMTLLR